MEKPSKNGRNIKRETNKGRKKNRRKGISARKKKYTYKDFKGGSFVSLHCIK